MTFNITLLKLPQIKQGYKNSLVLAWQSFLQETGFPVTPDGDFGKMTDQATRNYQRQNNLPITGIVDNKTYEKAAIQGFLLKVPNLSANLLLNYLRFGDPEIIDLQSSLNAIAQLTPPIKADGDFGANSIKALTEAYKKRDVRLKSELEAQLTTKAKLGDDLNLALDIFSKYAKQQRFRLSGPYWADRFPTSNLIADIASPFRERVLAFQKALLKAGCQVAVKATYRPRERAFLMHYAAQIHSGNIDPESVPAMDGVDIDWVHYTAAGSLQAAQLMLDAYDIGDNPVALKSRHTQRLAVDWEVTWKGKIRILDGYGRTITIGDPPNSTENQDLWQVGESYGVYKLAGDPPHWSVDGY
jgi:Putative peptidoglycan binding domain